MSSYTITITPDDSTLASTTLRVDVSENLPRITELMVRAGAAAGLSPRQLPAVDLDLLLRAVSPGAVPAVGQQAPESLPAAEAPANVAEAPAAEESPRSPGRRRRAAAAAEPKQTGRAAKRTGRKAAAEQPAKSGRAAKAAKAGGERAYRRAPDDLVDVFRQLGGVTAVARHYQVPRYTAQSWIRRLRREGQVEAGS